MRKTSLSALAAVGVLAGMTGANAADLGGNCCADLEERIAELEATTARKGNRKVSLTISGWVSQQVSFWDDGVEKNTYVSDLGGTLNSNVKFSGSAKISPDWTAGYLLHIEAESNGNLGLNANQDNSAGAKGVSVLQSFWFLKSESFGKLSVGLQSSAADNAALLPDGSGSLIFANYIMYDINAFALRRKGTGAQVSNWGSLATCQSFTGADSLGLGMDCDGVPNDNVRYDTPTFAGFSASASWGEDDVWALSGRYAGEFSGFKLAAAVGYVDSSDDNGATVAAAGPPIVNTNKEGFEKARGGKQASALQIGAYVQHVPTGLFVYGAYGKDYNDRTGGQFGSFAGTAAGTGAVFGTGGQQKDAENFYIKAGIRQKWSPLGASVLYGEYGENRDKFSNAAFLQGVTSSTLTQWGIGFVQEIDAAAMSLFMNYRNYQADVTCRAGGNGGGICGGAAGGAAGGLAGKQNFEDAQLFKAGAIINF
jgi:Gram-negative porin